MTLNKHYKKIILGVLIAVMVVGALTPGEAAAGEGWFGLPTINDALASIAEGIGYLIGAIAGVALTLTAWLIVLALNVNANILNSTFVTAGWQIVLSFTNLGFVLAIIVMAFATILRWESYGMKQILWKLIVAALLVNFSLVIAGAFLSVADILTNYLMSKGGFGSYEIWPQSMANMFKIQSFMQTKPEFDSSILGTLGNVGTKALSTPIAVIASVIFAALFTIIICIIFLAIFVMLLIRYVLISILLILSPIVWLLWIFPDTQNLWQKWWDNFLRWTFFAPIMLFFVYLAVYSMNNYTKPTISGFDNLSKGFTFGLDVIGNFAVALGLLFGGLMAANYLSITGASTAMGMAQRGSMAVGAFAGRKGLQYGTGWMRKQRKIQVGTNEDGTPKFEEKSYIDRFSARVAGSRLATWTGVGFLAQGAAKLAAAGGEDQLKRAQANIKDKGINEQIAMLSTADISTRAAIVQSLRDKDLLHLLPEGFLDKNVFTHKERARWKALGQGKDYEKLERRAGRNVEMVTGIMIDDQGIESSLFGKGIEDNEDKFFGTFRHEDWQKLSADSLLDKTPHTSSGRTYGDIRMRAIAENDPSALATILSKAKQKQIGEIRKEINNIEKNIINDLITTNLNAGKDIISDLDNIIKSIEGPSFDIGAAGLMDATDPVKNITKKLEWIQKKDKNKFNNLQDDIKLILQRNKTINRNLAGRFSEFEFVPGAFQQQTP